MLFLLALVLALPVTDERAAFYAASEKPPAEAVVDLLALVARSPADAFADDALAEAARLCEEKLGDPLRARELYQRLLGEYPDSRLSRKAEARLEVLGRNLGADGSGAAAQAAWNDLLLRFPERSRAESIALATALLAEHPDFADAPRVDLWIAEQLDAMGEPFQALERYQGVQKRHPGSEAAQRARRAEADLLTATGRWEEAAAAYDELRRRTEDPLELELLDQAAARLASVRQRARLEWVAMGVAALLLTAMLVAFRRDGGGVRAFWPPPIEALYFLPVGVVLGLASLSEDEAIGRSTLALSGASFLVAWLAGAMLRQSGPNLRLARALLFGGGGLGLVACAAYVIAQRTGILELVIYTLTTHMD